MLGDFVSTFHQTGNEQILFIRITEDHSGAVGRRNHAKAVAPLFVGYRRRFPNLGGKLFGSLRCGAAHGEIRIIRGAAASGASMRFVAEAAASPGTGNTTEGKDRPVVTIGGDFLVVTIGEGAATVHESGTNDRADNFHVLRRVRTDARDEANLRGESGSVRSGQQHATLLHESLQFSEAVPAEAGPHIVRGIIFSDKVWRFWGVLPGQRIAPGRGHAVDDGGWSREIADRRKQDDVVLGVEIVDLRNRLRADVVIGNLEIVERQTPPAFGLRAEPGVHKGHTRGAQGMSLYAGSSPKRDDLQSQVAGSAIEVGTAYLANDQ